MDGASSEVRHRTGPYVKRSVTDEMVSEVKMSYNNRRGLKSDSEERIALLGAGDEELGSAEDSDCGVPVKKEPKQLNKKQANGSGKSTNRNNDSTNQVNDTETGNTQGSTAVTNVDDENDSGVEDIIIDDEFFSRMPKSKSGRPRSPSSTRSSSRTSRTRRRLTSSSGNRLLRSLSRGSHRARQAARSAYKKCVNLVYNGYRHFSYRSKKRQFAPLDVTLLVQSIQSEETSLSIISQVSLPFIIAGYGTVGAGMVLDIVQHWDVFMKVGEIFILVPALLGLKGNLEMTLASRLSTQANLGNMDSKKELFKMVAGNLSLVQAQAIVVGFLSSLTAMVMGWIPEGKFNMEHALLLCASSLFTASVASFILGVVMVVVVVLSRYMNINPDNVATPIAASLGDLVTLSLLAWVGNILFEAIGNQHWLAPTIIAIFLLLLPLWIVICVKNKYTDDVIYNGWTPVLSAMFISSVGGLILDYTVANYDGIAVFQPVINGVGGNLVAVHASRLSTTLHMKSTPSCMEGQSRKLKGCLNPFKVFFGTGVHARAARVLTMLTIPGHLLFIYTIYYMKAGHTSMTLLFDVFYLTAAILQVVLLIYIATWLVPLIWINGSDPDNVAIPYLTALGDLLGTGFLAIAFHLLYLIGDRDADVAD